MENKNMIKCKVCGADIAKGVKKCPQCGADQRNFFMRHKIITFILAIIIIGSIGSALNGGGDNKSATSQNTKSTSGDASSTKTTDISNSNNANKSTAKQEVRQRQVQGNAVDLNAGTFTGGKDVQVGLYDATPVEGQGNFTVNGSSGDLRINEVLGTSEGLGVSKVRVNIKDGDKIQLQGINKVHFEPVTTPFVTSVKEISLYSGIWTVGEDIAAGRYKAVPVSGSGNFVVYDQTGMPKVNEVLGGDAGGVKEVTFDIKDGEIINIASLNQVNITPVN